MKVIKGDNVKIITGKDRGKVSEVIAVLPNEDKIVVKGVNIVTKHMKQRQEKEMAGRIKVERPIHVSNVMVIDPNSGLPSRVKYEIKDGKKERVFKPTTRKSVKKITTKTENSKTDNKESKSKLTKSTKSKSKKK